MTVEKIARKDVVTVAPGDTVRHVVAELSQNMVGSVVVVDDETKEPIGIITDRDLAFAVGRGQDPETTSAREIMSDELFTVRASDGVYEALADMREAEVRRAPVVDGGALVGIVTLDDFVVLLSRELENVAGIIEAESPPYIVDTA